jgi:hypothetical protein
MASRFALAFAVGLDILPAPILSNQEGSLADPHQAITIIATALCDARKDHPDHAMDPEEAKQIAKCIVEALTDARFQIVPVEAN